MGLPQRSLGAIADAVWDELQSGHTTAGTYGRTSARDATKTMTYSAVAGSGNVGSVALFTVTGEVLIVAMSAFCTTLLTESGATATIALGVTGSTSLFIAATNAVEIDANEFWVDATPDANGIAVPAALKDIIITDNIINTVGATNITAGVIRYDVIWIPLSSNGNVVAA
jgi:glutamate dehydrogenase/leucine dehydrogenase